MLLRMLSLMLALMFVVSPVSASETTRQGLKTLYDEFHYSLSVEWDQKDKNFVKDAETKFQEGLNELRLQGMTNEELVEFAAGQFKDEKMKADFYNLLLMMKLNSMSASEVNKMVNNIVRDGYQRGASWNGEVLVKVWTGIAISLLVGGIIALIVNCAITGCEGSGSDDSSTGSDWDDEWSDDWCTETYVCDYYYDEYGEWSDCYYECW